MTDRVSDDRDEVRDRLLWSKIVEMTTKESHVLAEVAPGEDFTERTMMRLREVTGINLRLWRNILFPVAAVFVALLAALAIYHGHEKSDLSALMATQGKNGAWSSVGECGNESYSPALTALAVLALSRQQGESGEALDKAVNGLIAMQHDDGSFGEGFSKLYNHAFATYALITHELNNAKRYKPEIQKAIEFAKKNQNHFGGWDYDSDGEGNDTLTLWETAILAKASELGYVDDCGTLRKGLLYLQKKSREGLLDYRQVLDKDGQNGVCGIILTKMSTDCLKDVCKKYGNLSSLVNTLQASLDNVKSRGKGDFSNRLNGNDKGNAYSQLVSLLDE